MMLALLFKSTKDLSAEQRAYREMGRSGLANNIMSNVMEAVRKRSAVVKAHGIGLTRKRVHCP